MNGGRGMGEEDRLEEYGSPENSQPAIPNLPDGSVFRHSIWKRNWMENRKSERITEKICQAWYAEWILPNVNGKTTIWITERILPFDIPNVDPQIPSIRGCDLSSKLKGSLYSYRPDGFTFQRFVFFRRIRVRVFLVSLNQLTGFPAKKFQIILKFSFKLFSCNFFPNTFLDHYLSRPLVTMMALFDAWRRC